MKIAVLYVAVTNGPDTSEHCARFAGSWVAFPPLFFCDLWVACNGGPLSTEQNLILAPLEPKMIVRHNDKGYDVSAYQEAAAGPCKDYDAMLCLGQSLRFTRSGWLQRLADVWTKYGPGFYGFFASNFPRAHLQTSAFFTSPEIIRSYPVQPDNREKRYEFEHGERALWRRVSRSGKPVRCITWDGEWEPRRWREPSNILWRGDQSNLLFHHNHCENWAKIDARSQAKWGALADTRFK